MKQNLLKSFLLLCSFIVGSIAWADDYQLYSGELTPGNYIIYYDGKAMNTTVDKNRLQFAEVTPVDNVITTTDASIVWRIVSNGAYWTIYNDAEKKYAASTGTKNQAGMSEDRTSDNVMWTVTGTETYEFVNKANSDGGANANLRNNGTYGFACYSASTGGPLSLYKKVDTPVGQVLNPVINGETNFLTSTTVTITCATEGATIQYCVAGDGTHFTDYQTYTEPFQLAYGATVKAKAFKSGLTESGETTKVFTKVTPTPNVRDIAAVGTSDQYVLLTDALVTYKNGKYTYLEDWAGAMLLYCDNDLQTGDKLNGYMHVRNYTVYNGLPEVTAFELVEGCTKTSGNTVTPTEVTIADLTIDNASNLYSMYYSRYIKIVDATVTSAFASKNCTIEQDGKSIILRDQNSKATLTSTKDDVITVTGHVAIYNDTKQIALFEQSQIAVKEAPVIPTIAEVRAEAEGSTVTTQGIVTSCSVGPKFATAFIQDATAAICVYAPAESAADLAVGNKIEVSGKLNIWKNLLRIDEPTITVVSAGNTVTPEVVTVPEIHADWDGNTLAANMQGRLVKIEKATVTFKHVFGDNTSNAEIQQGDKRMMVIGIAEGIEYEEGSEMTLIGNVSNNGTLCIDNPTNIEITAPEEPEAPEEPNFVWNLTTNSYIAASEDQVSWVSFFASMVADKDESATKANNYLGGDANNRTSSRFYKNSQLTITPSKGYAITSVEFTATSESYATALKESAWDNAAVSVGEDGKTVTVTPTDGSAAFYAKIGATTGLETVKCYLSKDITIDETGYATYIAPANTKFPSGLTAYVVSEVKKNEATLTQVAAVAKETPVMLKGTGKYTIDVVDAEDCDKIESNMLAPSDGTAEGDGSTIYILAKVNSAVAFFSVAKGSKIPAGKAYLKVPGSAGVKAFYFDAPESETAIETIDNSQLSTVNSQLIYNLSGQRVNKAQKGIYIVNGKKVLK